MQRVSSLFALAFILVGFPLTSHAAPDSNSYWKAARTAAIVDALKKETPPVEIKNALLNSTRSEDRDFAKMLLIQWKKNSVQNVEAEFDRLILRDSTGAVVLVIQPMDEKNGSFRVNGGEWRIPEAGSVSQSLKKFLAPKSVANSAKPSIFDFVTPRAYAAEDQTSSVGTAFLYAFNIEQGGAPATALGHLGRYSPHEALLPTEGGILSRIADRILGKSQVQCSKDSASGRLIIAQQPVDFVVKKDGTMILKTSDAGQRVKVETSTATRADTSQVYDRDIRFTPCLDHECTKTSGPSYHSLKPYLKNPEDEYVNTALTFRPRDAKAPIFPIEFACEDTTDCHQMAIRDIGSLSERDRKWAVRYRNEANASLAKTRAQYNADVLSIRPLYACCQDAACTAAVLRKGIELKPSGASKESGTAK